MADAQFPVSLGLAMASPDAANAQLNYATGLQALKYRQDLAQSLLNDSERPLSSGIGARGMAYRVSPLEGLARALSGGAGALASQQNSNDAQKLMQTYGQQIGKALRSGEGSQPAATQPVANPMQPDGGFTKGNNTGGQSAEDAIAFIKQQEGFSKKPYGDYKQTSIGYGTRAQPGETSITPEAAEARLRSEASKIDAWINDNVKGPLTQGQRTALTSFGYNLGTGKGGLEDLLPNINAGNWQGVQQQMGHYVNAGGQPLQNLIDRRQLEGSMLLQPGKFADRLSPEQQAPAAAQSAQAAPEATRSGVQHPPWYVEGQQDEPMRLAFATDMQHWATIKAAAIRANSPTELERALAQSGLPAEAKQMVLQAWVRDKAGLVNSKEGTQLVQGPGGQVSMQPIPGAAAAKGQIEGAGAAAKTAGEKSAAYETEINDRGMHAARMLSDLREMQTLNTNPGLFAGVKEDVGKFFRSVGVSDKTIQDYLKVSPGNLEAAQKLTANMATEAVKQIGSRPTQMEFQKFLDANPNIFQTPEGLKRVVEFMRNAANDTMGEQKAFYDAKIKEGLRPENYRDFEQRHNIERQQRIEAGQLASTPAPATAQPQTGGPPTPPKVGHTEQGYRFNGGNPGDPSSWTKVQ